MVAIVGCSETQVRDNFDNTNLTSDPQCICCKHLQQELETVILELQSAKKIIEFLYVERNSSAQHTYTYSQGENASFLSSSVHNDCEKNTANILKKLVTLEENTTNIQKYNNNNNLYWQL